MRSEGTWLQVALTIKFVRLSLNGIKSRYDDTAVEGSINRRISNEAGLDKKGDSPK
jgi:hypothetical protein